MWAGRWRLGRINDCGPERVFYCEPAAQLVRAATITSVVSLPKDVFDNILFHSEVLIFNMPALAGHYFLKPSPHEQQRTVTPQRQSAFAQKYPFQKG